MLIISLTVVGLVKSIEMLKARIGYSAGVISILTLSSWFLYSWSQIAYHFLPGSLQSIWTTDSAFDAVASCIGWAMWAFIAVVIVAVAFDSLRAWRSQDWRFKYYYDEEDGVFLEEGVPLI